MVSYQLQQPRTLESRAMKRLAAWVVAEVEQLHRLGERYPNKLTHLLSRRIELIRNLIECKMPRMFYDKLATEVIEVITQLLKQNNVSLRCGCLAYIKGRTIETLFTNNLTSLSFPNKYCEVFHNSLYSKSDLLTGLTHLNLTGFPKKSYISLSFKQLHSLKYLVIRSICTDDVLQCIVENCKLIETLKIYNREINDNSINKLIQLRELKHVKLNGTSVTSRGIETLVTSCPNIEHIGTHEEMSHILANIVSHPDNVRKQFKLTSYEKKDALTLEQLQLVVRTCPLIQRISLIKNEPSTDYVQAVHDVQDLRELKLCRYNFYADRVKEVLQARGRNLVQFNLDFNDQIDLSALKIIYRTCPNLKCLMMRNCSFVQEMSPQHFPCSGAIPPLRCLKRLSLAASRLTHAHITFLLSNCPNVEFVNISGMQTVMDNILLEVLEKTPRSLMYLKKLKISDKLSALVIDRIVQHCVNYPTVVVTRLSST